jgi:ABC-2 type transport system permease protein
MIAIELRKLFRRPRTWLTIALLDLLPTIVAILLAVTHVGPRPGEGPAFLSAVLANGSLFAVAALAIVLPLFLPVAVAVIAGDSVAGEAQQGTLRYLLIRPVGRTRLLVAKLVATFTFVAVAVVIVSGTGYVVGRLLLGHGSQASLSAAVTSVSGSALTPGQIVWRTIITIGYVAFSMLGVAAMALFLSTLTDSPLSASLGALAFLIGSSLLLTLGAARALVPYLPTRYWLSFVDLFRDPILWRNVERGMALQAVYVLVLLGAAWANFTTKDIKS